METTNSIVEKIHREASIAETKLIQQAEEILKKSKDDEVVQKIEKLKNLGFKNFKEAVELSPEKIKQAQEVQSHINTYRLKSPTTKFMSDDAVKELCEKYGLIQAPVELYVDSIPTKNMQEILDFKIDENFLESSFLENIEATKFTFKLNNKKNNYNLLELFNSETKPSLKKIINPVFAITDNWKDSESNSAWSTRRREGILNKLGGKLTPKILDEYSNIILSCLKIAVKHGYLKISFEEEVSYNELVYNFIKDFGLNYLNPVVIEAAGRLIKGLEKKGEMELHIIAPKHMLDLSQHEIDSNCKAVKKGIALESPNVKEWFIDNDPIVQVKVKGGFLNITAWGAEAEMQESFNEKLN